ncbi:helix-turn-helix transcriptional regulator [Rhodococcus sp. ABRD24]|uniref:helix-turn-helix domain-containing protein n=1 Tax=Rhodococcus sp. ABRD24 TaxID=2507582 RepID=UPI0013F14B6E|nr:helix-turn-helix transcriptional regulator [Rhodococcus sp. ABRD24]
MDDASSEDRLGVDLARAQNQLVRELRARRVQLNLSAGEVAARMGVDPSFVSRFEQGGTNATFATIRRYAKAVDAMVTYGVCSYQEHKTKVIAERADAVFRQPREEPENLMAQVKKPATRTVLVRGFSARVFPETPVST